LTSDLVLSEPRAPGEPAGLNPRPTRDPDPEIPAVSHPSPPAPADGALDARAVTVVVADFASVGAHRRLAFAVFQQAVTEEGGEAQPIRGGLALGLFGHRQSLGNEPARAVRAGLVALGLNARTATDTPMIVGLRVAVGTGTVVGKTGDLRGEAIESACALIARAEPGELIVDEETAQRSGALVEASPRGDRAHVVLAARRSTAAWAAPLRAGAGASLGAGPASEGAASPGANAKSNSGPSMPPLAPKNELKSALKQRRDTLQALESRGLLREAAAAALEVGDALADRGDPVAAHTHYERAYTFCRQHPEPKLLGAALVRLGRLAYATSDIGQAVRLFEEARRTFEGIPDREGEAEATLRLGAAYWQAGHGENALALLESARQYFKPERDALEIARVNAYHAAVLVDLGHGREGLEALERSFEGARALGDCRPVLLAGSMLARALLDARRDIEARDLAKELYELARHNLPRFVLPLGSTLGLALARCGDPQGGLRTSEAAVRRLRSHKACEDEDPQRICAHHAEVLELANRKDSAASMWARAGSTLREVETRLPETVRRAFRERPINRRILARSRVPTSFD
jgi:tetratricopeptide (TPR) repeat protein